MSGIADILATVAAAVLLIAILGGGISQDEINAACVGKGGVIGYSDHSWGVTNGAATVICGDHKAYKVDQ